MFYEILCIVSITISLTFFIVFAMKTFQETELSVVFLILFFLSSAFVPVLYYESKIRLNEYECNPYKYIKKKFSFLLHSGYIMCFSTSRGRQKYTFRKGRFSITLFIKSNFATAIVLNDERGQTEERIEKILKNVKFGRGYRSLPIMGKVNFLANAIDKNLTFIENYEEKEG